MSQQYYDILYKMFIESKEYVLANKKNEKEFIQRVLWSAEDLYNRECYYREYPEFKDFLYTHHVDSIAYWTTDEFELVQ